MAFNDTWYPGMPQNYFDPGQQQGNFSPNWTPGMIADALRQDQAREARIQYLVDKIVTYDYWADISMPFTGVAGETVQGQFIGTSDPVIITGAQTTIPNCLFELKSESLNQTLTQGQPLLSSMAFQQTSAMPFARWVQPLLIPPTTVLTFKFVDYLNQAFAAPGGILSLRGRSIKPGQSDPRDVQELFNLLGNYPFWVDVPIAFTGSAGDPTVSTPFKGISNPIIVLGMTTDLNAGSVTMKPQVLSEDLMTNPVRLLSVAGQALAANPVQWLETPLVNPPMKVLNFKFSQDATNAQPAGHLALVTRLIQQ